MITIEQYFSKPHIDQHTINADVLLGHVNALCAEAEADGVERCVDPDTGTEISGAKGGDGDGGFRTPGSRTGAPESSHKKAAGVDVCDPSNALDRWIDLYELPNGDNSKLKAYGLYREAPDATPGWCHLTTRAPGSGRRTFRP